MDLQILISKKGTQVVKASQLHQVLQLPAHKYNGHIEKWLKDIYAFQDDVRQPEVLKDYAPIALQHSKRKDYYLSLEMAKLITLNSDSKVKLQFARWLRDQEGREPKTKTDLRKLSKEQITTIIELTKVMSMMSCQQSAEQMHRQYFKDHQHGPSDYKWWQYRAGLLGYSVTELRSKMLEIGKQYKGKKLSQVLAHLDQYEIIRLAVIDLFIALGQDLSYATTMGDLARLFAQEMKIEIWDDRQPSLKFGQRTVNTDLANEVKSMRLDGYLQQLCA